MAEQVFLIRHGQSTFNEAYEATGVDPLHFDARLTALGRLQVAQARAAVQAIGADVAVLSPLTRAIETGIGLFSESGTRLVVSALHRERLGNSCDVGREPEALAAEFPMLDFSHLPARWWHDGPRDWRGLAIEPETVLARRILEFERWVVEFPGRTVAVVGHGTFFNRLTGRHFENCEMVEWRP